MTKKCPHCQTDIPLKAKKCPQCQSDLRSWINRHPVITFFLLVFFIPIVLTIALSSDSSSSTSTETVVKDKKADDIKLMARVIAEKNIERMLKSPKTADFCYPKVSNPEENRYLVVSCVDSENSFGAMLRSNWTVELHYLGGDELEDRNWMLDRVVFDGETIYKAD